MIILVLFNDSIGSFNSETQVRETELKCERQITKYCRGSIEESELSPECVREKYFEGQTECDRESALDGATGLQPEGG